VTLPADGAILAPATLRAHLKARLPHYMVPAAFVLMDTFPLTPNGKIDRHAFPAVSFEGTPSAPLSTSGAAPAPEADAGRPFTETEARLASIWTELLKVEHVGVEDDFFDLGGQSLVAIRAVSRIRDAFGVDLPLRDFFERPTLAGLAEVIDGLSWVAKAGGAGGAWGPPPAHEAGEREEIVL
jgi:acyl carrier protein